MTSSSLERCTGKLFFFCEYSTKRCLTALFEVQVRRLTCSSASFPMVVGECLIVFVSLAGMLTRKGTGITGTRTDLFQREVVETFCGLQPANSFV